MKFVIDRHIPFIKGVLEPFGTVVYSSPDRITPELVRDADALLVRTRTRIDKDLLEDSKCGFVATATIGMDHFDQQWCIRNGINIVNAPGCNAPAVAQYVLSAICTLWSRPLNETTIGIIGVGNVGSIVSRWCKALGMNVMAVDPFRQQKETDAPWFSLAETAEKADIITFHTPLTQEGDHPTYHLVDSAFFDRLGSNPLIINSSRGAVIDNKAWLNAIEQGKLSGSVVDVWENEPFISTRLLELADIATPHIAGYSLDGKIRATQMVLDALSGHFRLPSLRADARKACSIPETVTTDNIRASYDIFRDDRLMRREMDSCKTPDEIASTFEQLRDTYSLRNEIDKNLTL